MFSFISCLLVNSSAKLMDNNLNLREKSRFDYRIFAKTGVKVPITSSKVTSDKNMSVEAKVSGELTGLLFQIDELLEELQDVSSISLVNLQKCYEEFKGLRVTVVKVNSQLKILQGDGYDRTLEERINEKLSLSKALMNSIKTAMLAKEENIEKANVADQNRLRNENLSKKEGTKICI